MKLVVKLENLGLLLLFLLVYVQYYHGSWLMLLYLFFIPDLSFAFYFINKKAGTGSYNFIHHKGVMALLMLAGYFLQNAALIKTGLVFMMHSCFDRVAGYGLKYFDSFDHTHLGWIGKGKRKA